MSDIRIVYSKLLGSYFVVRGEDLTPISGAFYSKEQAKAWLDRPSSRSQFRFIPKGYKIYRSMMGGEVLVFTKEERGRISSQCFIGKATKPSWFYSFKDQERLDKYISETVEARTERQDAKKKAQAERSKPTGVKVGDVFMATWGYEQTNIDYYQVTRLVGRQSVEVREIRQLSIETGDMRGKCAPAIGDFKGEPMIKRIQNYSGTATIKIASYAQAYLLAPVGMIGDVPVYRPANWTAYA